MKKFMKKIFKKNNKDIDEKARFDFIKIMLFILMSLLLIRLAYLTLIKGDYYRNLSENSRIREVEIVAPRGNIYDRNGDLLAGNKVVYTASIMKDEFSSLTLEEQNENLLKLSRFLDLDGASYNTDYSISLNLIKYKDEEDYKKEEESPSEKMINIIKENDLMEQIIKKEYKEETKNGVYEFRVADMVIKAIKNKGFDIPLKAGSDKLEFEESENPGKNEFLINNGYYEGQSVYEFLGKYSKDDESIIRSILSHPVGRKLSYDILEENKVHDNLILVDIGSQDDELLVETKTALSKKYNGITEKTSPKEDFAKIVEQATLDKLLENVTLNTQSDKETVVPAKEAIKLLDKNKIENDLQVEIDESDPNKPKAIVKYEEGKGKDILAKDLLKALLVDNNLVEKFVTSDDIKYIAQSVNTENNVIPQISVVTWKYVYEENMDNLFKRFELDRKKDSTEDLYKVIKKEYKLKDYSKYDSYNILKIHDNLANHGDLRYVPMDLTYNISETTYARIEENFPDNTGIFVDSESIRYYPYGDLASHTIGYMGKIATQSEQDKYLKEEKYNPDSLIGKTGIEESQEMVLKGTNGFKRVMIDNKGNTTEVLKETKAVAGMDVYTSIDRKVQQAAEEALEKATNALTNGIPYKSDWGDVPMSGVYPNALTGSVVVLDAKTGQAIAIANEPDINLNMFSTGISSSDWTDLFPKNEKDLFAPRPLLNIAMQSEIQPGSTFKLATYLSAYENGFNPNYVVNCQGAMTIGGKVYQDAIWDSGKVHGSISSREAIRDSCNIYLYNLALGVSSGSINGGEFKLNINQVAEAAKTLGLGEPTGIDINIPAESTGVLPDPKIKKATYRSLYKNFLDEYAKEALKDKKTSEEELIKKIEEINSWIDEEEMPSEDEVIRRLEELGFNSSKEISNDKGIFSTQIKYDFLDQSQWLLGDTLNVSIGQGQNAYTPLQMARYIATVANGGYKNKVSVVDKVVDYNTGKSIYENTPSSEKIKINDYNNLEILREGTKMAAEDKVNSGVLGKLPFKLGIKSGTAEPGTENPVTGNLYDNHGLMVGYAPYDDPKYVIAVVMPQSGSSVNVTPIVRDVLATALEVYPKGTNTEEEAEETEEDVNNQENQENLQNIQN